MRKANCYNEVFDSLDSRFRITITVAGSNGIQNISAFKKYYANEVVRGTMFKAIEYTAEDQRKKGMRYYKINNFWKDFNTIIDDADGR